MDKESIIAVLQDTDTSHGTILLLEEDLETSKKKQTEPFRLRSVKTSTLPEGVPVLSSSRIPDYLRVQPSVNGDKNIHIIISTHSGTRLAKPFFKGVLEPVLTCVGVKDFQVHETTSSATVTNLTHSVFVPRARDGISQTIIMLSGDGGLVDLVNVIYADPAVKHAGFQAPTVAMIAMGTGNAMANSAGLIRDKTFGLSALFTGSPHPLPTFCGVFSSGSQYVLGEGCARESIGRACDAEPSASPRIYGAVVASWGMHASLVADSDTVEYRRYGAERFKLAAKELLYPTDGTETHRYKGKISLIRKGPDGGSDILETLDRGEHMYFLVTLVSHLEQGFAISPRSKPLDGQMRVVHFGPLPPETATSLMGLAYQGGKHVLEKEVGYEDVDGIRIDFAEDEERWRRLCVDGRIIVIEKGGWAEIRKDPRQLIWIVARA